jgi:large subunit ribosomal protein L4
MKDLTLNVYSQKGDIVGKKTLPSVVFGVKPNDNVIYEAIKMYQANQRQGTLSTKTRGEVRGGGRKPWRQKGTGRARVGSIRSPLWRGGGVIFGPKPRNYHYRIPQKKLKLALLSTISYKVREGRLLLLDNLDFPQPRTKLFSSMLQALGLGSKKKVLFTSKTITPNTKLSGRNIKSVSLKPAKDIHALDIAKADVVVFSLDGVDEFISRIKGEKAS